MKVRVYAPAFVDQSALAPDGTLALPDGATLRQVYRALKLPLALRLSFFCSVNYEPAHWNTKLKDGDSVSFLVPFSGG